MKTMDKQTILDELKKVLAPYTENKEALNAIDEHTNLIKDLKINSANIIDIIIDAETRYDIEIDVDSAEKMGSVGSCIAVIMEKMQEKQC
jgi:acyl carrier protein